MLLSGESREEDEMKLADAGSWDPWFPAQEFLLEEPVMAMLQANFNFTLDLFASYKNRITKKYFSAAFECESAEQNFFKQKISPAEFCLFFPPPRLFWPAFIHLASEKARGVGVFALWFALPITSKFLHNNHLPECVVLFRMMESRIK